MASTKWQQQKMDRTNKRHPLMVAAQRIHGAPVRVEPMTHEEQVLRAIFGSFESTDKDES